MVDVKTLKVGDIIAKGKVGDLMRNGAYKLIMRPLGIIISLLKNGPIVKTIRYGEMDSLKYRNEKVSGVDLNYEDEYDRATDLTRIVYKNWDNCEVVGNINDWIKE